MKIKQLPHEIWSEYNAGIDYKSQLNLYDDVEFNQNFYNGNQWEGVNAPDIEKPVVNICRQAVDYFVSMLVSDDIGVTCNIPDGVDEMVKQAVEHITSENIEQVFEQTKFKQKTRLFIKDCAINGDAFFHWWYNTDKNPEGKFIGAIDLEIVDSVNVVFGDPAEFTVDLQPYILVVSKLPLDKVKDMVEESEQYLIVPDGHDLNTSDYEAHNLDNYATVITKLWKEGGTVWYTKTTQKAVITKPVNLRQKSYPIVKQSWKHRKNSYHGISPLTEIRQNQIMINKYYMMLNEFIKKLSFPKLLYDMTKIPKWTNKIESIGVNGDPSDAIAMTSPTVQLSEQVIGFIENLIDKTKSTLGIYDVALGNVQPENTSAIIALQKTASQPLELQRLDYMQVVEDSVRIIIDIMSAFYGIREVPFKSEQGNGVMPFDYKDLSFDDFGMVIEVGSAYYWSEVTQIQTLDNMYKNGIIPDAITYLEQLPNGVLKNRGDIIDAIRIKQQMEQQMMLQQQLLQPKPNGTPSVPTNTVGGVPVNSLKGVQ
jgi:hypothetical protein